MTKNQGGRGRPKRQKKSDRLLHSGQTQNQVMCDFALAPLDRLAIEMDRKWGIDVLPELVSVEMAQKYGSAMAKLNDAIVTEDPAVVAARAEVCMRGLQAMDKAAEEAGRSRAPMDLWEVEVDGEVYGVMKDGRSWQEIKDKRPELKLVTLREVAVALDFYGKHAIGIMTEEVRKHFEKAEIIGHKVNDSLEDEIPW